MSLELVSMEFRPRGTSGWTSGPLPFGAFTLIRGPNGAGKTPIIKGIPFALGLRMDLPKDIKERCSSIDLYVRVASGEMRLSRSTAESFALKASGDADPQPITFTDEKEYSLWLLERIDASPRLMTGKQGGGVIPYASLHIPMWWVDQDRGWTWIYAPEGRNQFVKDQEEEMIRFSFALPARFPYEQREELANKQKELEVLDAEIAIKREALEKEVERNPSIEQPIDALEQERERLEAELEGERGALHGIQGVGTRFDRDIDGVEDELRKDRADLAALEQESRRLEAIVREISAEVEILGSNQTAEQAFINLCGNPQCQLFKNTSASYGRRLLYLKDQMKDVSTASGLFGREMAVVRKRIGQRQAELQQLREARTVTLDQSGHGETLVRMESLAERYAGIVTELGKRRGFTEEVAVFEEMVEQRSRALDEIKALKRMVRDRTNDPEREGQIVSDLATSMSNWLEILGTQNVGERTVEIDDRFNVVVGGTPFTRGSDHSGSTRTRIVLAFHAAALEVAKRKGGYRPDLLVLDSPRQHELDEADLKAYLLELRTRCPSAQVVFTSKDLDLPLRDSDKLWTPPYGEGEAARFLGDPTGPSMPRRS